MTVQVGDVVGDYRVKGIAGSGGMGEVYRIEHIITKRIEAMKLLPPGLSSEPEQVQRFEREIQVQARLQHPNIVTVYNAVRDGASVALVMEFVEGESLQRMLEAGALPFQTAVHYARQVLSALAYAHESGVIHRDVAPANIIITQDGVVKLSDFGLARAETDLRLTSAGVPVGSPWYMSPEQVRGIGVIDSRTDLYAVGAVLHEMLTGRKLFDADGAFSVMRAQVEATPAAPSSLNAAVPAALDAIVGKALEKDRELRFQSADEFRAALERAVPESPPLAAATAPARRPRRNLARAAMGWLREGGPVFGVQRRTLFAALAPGVLLLGFFAIWPLKTHAPKPERRPAAEQISPAAVADPVPALPEAAPPETTPLPSPPPKVAVVEAAKPAPVAARISPAPVHAARPAGKAEPSHALRVTGAEIVPPAGAPAAPREVVPEAGEAPPVPAAAPTLPAAPAVAAAPMNAEVPPPAPPQEAEPKPAKGNRFVRALGKINPFKKTPKDEETKPPEKRN